MKTFKLFVPLTLFWIVACIAFTACNTSSDLKPVNLRTEYKENPVTDCQHPRMSWELNSAIRGQVQTAWQILVASSAELLATDKADLWNSEKIKSNASNEKQNNNQMKRAMRNIFTPT
jgi:alpha-L-rhamnosidase